MKANEEISFPSHQIPSMLGYNTKLYESDEYRIGYKTMPSFDASYEIKTNCTDLISHMTYQVGHV